MSSFRELLDIPLSELRERRLRKVVVAVVDTGLDATHEVLRGRVKRAIGYERGHDGADVAVELDCAANNDPAGHGTGAAGIIATLAPNSVFIDYRVLDSSNSGYGSTVLKGIEDAIESEAEVISVSVSVSRSKYWSKAVELLERAYLKNKVVIASKRNIPQPDDIGTPAELSNVIGVDSAEYATPFVFAFLNSAPIDFSANGFSVMTAKTGGGYHRLTGTSFATPTISALIALFRGANGHLRPFEIKTLLKQHSENIPPEDRKSNPLEQAPRSAGDELPPVDYECSHCGAVSKVRDAFPFVKCRRCGMIGERDVLLDPGIYSSIIGEIKTRLDPRYVFHDWRHTRDVVFAVFEILGHYRRLPLYMKRALLLAAVLHDYGYVTNPADHESEAAHTASIILQVYKIPRKTADLVKSLVLATKPDHVPTTLCEKIIRDADLYHLRKRSTRRRQSNALRRELANFGETYTDAEWRRREDAFFAGHRFHLTWLEKKRTDAMCALKPLVCKMGQEL